MPYYFIREEGKYDEAIASFRQANEMKPDEYLVNHYLGQLLLLTDQSNEKNTMDEAIQLFRTNIETEPKKAEARYGLAASLYTKSIENVDEVEQEAKECAQIDPTHEKCLALLAHLGVEVVAAPSDGKDSDSEGKGGGGHLQVARMQTKLARSQTQKAGEKDSSSQELEGAGKAAAAWATPTDESLTGYPGARLRYVRRCIILLLHKT
jgi:tetratricopeptide (TPR) repeat protein